MGFFGDIKRLISGLAGAKHVERAERKANNTQGAARLRNAMRQADVYSSQASKSVKQSESTYSDRPRKQKTPEPVPSPKRHVPKGISRIVDIGATRVSSLLGSITSFLRNGDSGETIADEEILLHEADKARQKANEEKKTSSSGVRSVRDLVPPPGTGWSLPPIPPRVPPGGGPPFGDDAQRWIDSGEWHEVESSNVYAIAYEKDKQAILVQFLNWEPGCWNLLNEPGAIYRYRNQNEAAARSFYENASKGVWIWDNLRVRSKEDGIGWGSRAGYELVGVANEYIPRKALSFGYFGQREHNGQYSTLESGIALNPQWYAFRREYEALGFRPDRGTDGINRARPDDGKPRR